MSDEPNKPDTTLMLLRDRLVDLQQQATVIGACIQELQALIDLAEPAPRRRSGPKPRVVRLSEEPPAASTEPTDAA